MTYLESTILIKIVKTSAICFTPMFMSGLTQPFKAIVPSINFFFCVFNHRYLLIREFVSQTNSRNFLSSITIDLVSEIGVIILDLFLISNQYLLPYLT